MRSVWNYSIIYDLLTDRLAESAQGLEGGFRRCFELSEHRKDLTPKLEFCVILFKYVYLHS